MCYAYVSKSNWYWLVVVGGVVIPPSISEHKRWLLQSFGFLGSRCSSSSSRLFMSPPPHEMTRSESARTTSVAVVVTTVDVLTAASKLKEDYMIMYLDVRTEEEMAKGHLPGSLNIPYMFITPQGKSLPHRLGPGRRTIGLWSRSPPSSPRTSTFLWDVKAARGLSWHAAGFMNVKNVGGGYAAWVDNGLPIAVAATVHTPPDSVAAT